MIYSNPQVVEEAASVQNMAPLESREFDPLGQMNQDQVFDLNLVLLRKTIIVMISGAGP